MIRRIKLTQTPSLFIEDFLSSIREFADPISASESDELDILLKYAMHTNSPAAPAPNANRVWKKLSGRVRGPFGRIAVEGPQRSGEEIGTGHGHQAPFTLGDDASSVRPSNSQETTTQHIVPFGAAKESMLLA